jgi:hypothetical protein
MSRTVRSPAAACALSLITCSIALSACGGGGAPAADTSGAPSGAASAAAPYRWLVPTRGVPPSIAAENRARGTVAWRLPGPSYLLGGAAHGAVEGYVASDAVVAGETQRVYVSAPGAAKVAVSVYRMGFYGGRGGRLVLQSSLLPVVRQPRCTHAQATGLTECNWHATLSFAIPPALPSGVYIVKLDATSGAQADTIFVVRSARPAPLLLELPTASWEAYNAWGGNSLYPGATKTVEATGTTQGVEVSYDRPYESQTGAGQFFIREVAMVRFLERYGYPVSYTTIDSIDAQPAQVQGARALIDAGHSEYWSRRDAQAFMRARDAGTNLIFLSSDTTAWEVRFEAAGAASSESGAPAHRIAAYKQYEANDPDTTHPTGLFPLLGANLTGSAYDGCITPRIAAPGPPIYRYYAWTPSPVLSPSWLFSNTGVTPGTQIPGIVGYELDERTPSTPRGTQVLGGGSAACMPENEPLPVHGTRAETTLYTARSGAFVFSSGTLGWLYGLEPVPQASPDVPTSPDPRVVAITRNLLAHALGR